MTHETLAHLWRFITVISALVFVGTSITLLLTKFPKTTLGVALILAFGFLFFVLWEVTSHDYSS